MLRAAYLLLFTVGAYAVSEIAGTDNTFVEFCLISIVVMLGWIYDKVRAIYDVIEKHHR